MAATPILDLELPPPKLRRSYLPILVGLAAGTAAELFLTGIVHIDPLWCLPILYASIAVHEFGHLAAAKLVGMKIGGIAVGGFLLFRSGDRWIPSFDWRRLLSGGLAKPLVDAEPVGRGSYGWLVAGGPIATVLLIALPAGWRFLYGASEIGESFVWINAFLLLSTAIPASGLNQSDIPELIHLLRHAADFRSRAATLQIASEETAGVLPRDWNAANFADMMAGGPGRTAAYRHMLAFYRKVDERDEAAAFDHLEQALAASGAGGAAIRQWCFLEAACSSAVLRGDAAAGREWLARGRKIRRWPASLASVEAGIAQAEGRYRDALDLWDAALVFLARRKFDSGLARYSKAKIAEFQAQCRRAQAAA